MPITGRTILVGAPVDRSQRHSDIFGGVEAGLLTVGRPPRSGRPAKRRAANRLVEPERGRRRRGSTSSRVRPDGAAALLAGGPVWARWARREVDGRRFFVDKGQFSAEVRAVVVTVRGILDHFAQQGASGHGMVFAQDRCHAS
jgi:hypothetical protein